MTNTNFTSNSVVGLAATGGAFYCYSSPSLYMSDCIFTNNSVTTK